MQERDYVKSFDSSPLDFQNKLERLFISCSFDTVL